MKKYPKQESLEAVKNEIARAREKFPNNKHLLAALTEEVGELNKAYLEGDFEHAKTEAIQVACVALRILEEGDSDFQKEENKKTEELKFDLEKEIRKYLSVKYFGLSKFSFIRNILDSQDEEIIVFWIAPTAAPFYRFSPFHRYIIKNKNQTDEEIFKPLMNIFT